MNGLTSIHLELTSRCNKSCWMCGRRKMERDYPDLCDWGDMDYGLVKEIAKQVPSGIVIQFHNSGDPLCYPYLGKALRHFKDNIRCFDTNGKILAEKADEIIGRLESLTLSVIENEDPQEKWNQRDQLFRFLNKKGDRKPFMVYRLLGDVDDLYWKKFPGIICKRTIHAPMGSYDYKKPRVIPETGICQDLLTHLAIDRFGRVSPCVRFDPKGEFIIGDLNNRSLEEIWNNSQRQKILKAHIEGKRNEIEFCSKCDYWGCPS